MIIVGNRRMRGRRRAEGVVVVMVVVIVRGRVRICLIQKYWDMGLP
jgi:hypothetical protein